MLRFPRGVVFGARALGATATANTVPFEVFCSWSTEHGLIQAYYHPRRLVHAGDISNSYQRFLVSFGGPGRQIWVQGLRVYLMDTPNVFHGFDRLGMFVSHFSHLSRGSIVNFFSGASLGSLARHVLRHRSSLSSFDLLPVYGRMIPRP